MRDLEEFLVPNYLGLSFVQPCFWLGIHKKNSRVVLLVLVSTFDHCLMTFKNYQYWPVIEEKNPVINQVINNLPVGY